MSYPAEARPTTYFATGALADREIVTALLGVTPSSSPIELCDCALGMVTGEEVNSHLRMPMFPDDYRTRVLIHQRGGTVNGVLYNVTPEQLEAIRMYTGEGVVTQAVALPLGDHEVTGHAEAHFLKRGLTWSELLTRNGRSSQMAARLRFSLRGKRTNVGRKLFTDIPASAGN